MRRGVCVCVCVNETGVIQAGGGGGRRAAREREIRSLGLG